MKVFISWSGARGRMIGDAFKAWLPDVIQSISPFYSPDIEKGQRWSLEIEQSLKEAKAGIICVTPESMLSPWLMFESGAISNAKLSRVCPLLFNVDPAQLQGPLSQFQATPFSREEVRKLIAAINDLTDNPLTQSQLDRTFDRCWPELDDAIKKALDASSETDPPKKRPQEEMIEEILSTVRALANSAADEDSINHWIVLFRGLMDFGNEINRIGNSSVADPDLEMMKATLNHLRLTLNLAQPKVAKSSRQAALMTEARAMMSRLESSIDAKDLPF